MQTEFTCGIYHAIQVESRWEITVNKYTLAVVTIDGKNVKFSDLPVHLKIDDLIEIVVLMNNIKRQYKQFHNA